MGGQACVLYGAAEFSRDLDITLLASPENLARLGNALADLQAEPIAVPPFERDYLEQGERLVSEPAPPRSLLAVLATLEPLNEEFPPIPELPTDSVDL